jgi:hypothetical protein
MRSKTFTSTLLWLPVAFFMAACDAPNGEETAQTDLGAPGTALTGTPTDTLTAQRDSLFSDVADNARLITQITEELNKVEGLSEPDSATVESPASATRERLLHKVQQVTTKLAESEQRLAQNRRQIRAATRRNDSLSTKVTEFEKMIADFEAMLESQRTTVASLTERVTALETENLALRDTITTMETEENTAYYVVGTKEELLERGIITKEGGSRVLFIFGKRGETLTPARQLDPSQFTAIDIRQVQEIPLPDSSAEYLIASRQNLDFLATGAAYGVEYGPAETPVYQETPPADTQQAAQGDQDELEKKKEKGRVKGAIRITDPEQFWLPSKFLIVVRT